MNTSLFLLAAIFVVTATEAGVVFPGWMQRRMIPCDRESSTDSTLQCLAPLEQFENFFNNLHLADVETLEYVCRHMNSAKQCAVNVAETCGQGNERTQLVSETIEGVINHFCSEEGKNVLVTETECWQNVNPKTVIEGCLRESYRKNGDPCEIIPGIRTCARDRLSLCNEQAINFVDGLLYYSLEPFVTEMFDCDMQLRVSRSIMELLSLTHKKK